MQMPKMAGNIAGPRLPPTQKCMKHSYVKLGIKGKVYAKTDDLHMK